MGSTDERRQQIFLHIQNNQTEILLIDMKKQMEENKNLSSRAIDTEE